MACAHPHPVELGMHFAVPRCHLTALRKPSVEETSLGIRPKHKKVPSPCSERLVSLNSLASSHLMDQETIKVADDVGQTKQG